MHPPSWHPDPTGRHELRWWDGQRWTDQVSDRGITSTDPPQAQPVPLQPAAWAAPTQPLPSASSPLPVAPSAPSGRRRTSILIGVAVAVLLVGVGVGVYINTGSDSEAEVVSTTTSPASTTSTTPTTDSTEPTITTTPSGDTGDAEALLALLVGVGDVPANWVLNDDGTTEVEPASGPGYGYCGGDNAAARAQSIGDVTIAYGPSWGLPDGSTFGADVLVFASDNDAQAFLDGTLQQANECAASPVTFTAPESDVDWLADGYGDDAEWNVMSLSTAVIGSAAASDAEVRGYVDDNYTATVDTNAFAVTYSTIAVYERHGRSVVLFWTDGSWGFDGFSSTPDWAHRPDDVELDRNIADYRDLIVTRLDEIGAL